MIPGQKSLRLGERISKPYRKNWVLQISNVGDDIGFFDSAGDMFAKFRAHKRRGGPMRVKLMPVLK
ncbi:MAG: hypothetical protein ACI92Z_000629 [Paracoccaceae bacterium]|jgi:hypothetical protein